MAADPVVEQRATTACRSRSRTSSFWLAAERGRAAGTIAAYRRDLRTLRGLAARAGAAPLDDVTEEDLSATSPRSAAAGWRRPRWPGRWCRSASLHRFLADEGRAPADPGAAPRAAPGAARACPKALTEDEVGRLLDAPVGDGPPCRRDRAMLEVLYGTGRPGVGAGGAVARRRRSRRRAAAGLRQGEQGADRARSACRPCGPWWRGSGPAAGRRWRPRSGAGAATPRPCSSTCGAGGCSRQGAWDVLRRYARRVGPRGQAQPRTCCATPARPTCWTTVPTSAPCRSCSGTPRSAPRRCTRSSPPSGCGRCTGTLTPGREHGR